MKLSVKRILILCLIAALICTVFTACQTNEKSRDDSSKTTATQSGGGSSSDDAKTDDVDVDDVDTDDSGSQTVALKDVHVIEKAHYTYNDYELVDTFGNSYYGFHDFTSGSSYAIFNLNGEYKKLTGGLVLDERSGSDYDFIIAIYADDSPVFNMDGITATTGKVDLDVDVAGCSQLKIEVENVGTSSFYGLEIVDAELEK